VRGPVLEVLVVDNASRTCETQEIAEEFGVRYVHEPTPGLVFARNRALLEARGQIIAYTDDDCEPEPRWVEAILTGFRDRDVACVTGKAIMGPCANHVQRQFESLSRSYCVNHEVTVSHADVGRFWYRGVCGVGANMALRRDFLLTSGGFRCGRNGSIAGEDDYIFLKVLRAGLKLRYTPASIVRERHRAGLWNSVARYFTYGVGAIEVMWILGAEDRSLRLVVENAVWLILGNLRQVVADLVRLRGVRALFGIAQLTGLLWGVFPSWNCGRASIACTATDCRR
jgi:glycosyltransferase involved in cell wall biosynthesis